MDTKPTLKEEFGEVGRTLAWAILIALVFRSLLFEPFSIPSGSMYPTLMVGDYVFVNKPAYGWGRYSFPLGFIPFEGRIFPAEPQRGDVVVFKRSQNTWGHPYIKRIVALPGEEVQMRGGRLYINGREVPREVLGARRFVTDDGQAVDVLAYTETLPGGVRHAIYERSDDAPLDNTEVYKVPEGHYFLMGDNRDHSQDSRVVWAQGPVPAGNIVGRADVIFFSLGGSIFKLWEWPWTLRPGRFFTSLAPERAQKAD